MIKWIKYTNMREAPNGYGECVQSLMNLVNKRINFTDGINFLVAANGTGKSTIIEDMAKYFCVLETGTYNIYYGTVQEITHGGFFGSYKPKNGLSLSTDGNVCYISNRLYGVNPEPTFGDDFFVDKLMERFNRDSSSSGQSSLRSFGTMWDVIRNMDFEKTRLEEVEKYKQKMNPSKEFDKALKYLLKPGLKSSKPTILIDELDSNMDILNTIYLFRALKQISNRYQIIMASHSALAFEIEDANFIELTPGYIDKCKAELKLFREKG